MSGNDDFHEAFDRLEGIAGMAIASGVMANKAEVLRAVTAAILGGVAMRRDVTPGDALDAVEIASVVADRVGKLLAPAKAAGQSSTSAIYPAAGGACPMCAAEGLATCRVDCLVRTATRDVTGTP